MVLPDENEIYTWIYISSQQIQFLYEGVPMSVYETLSKMRMFNNVPESEIRELIKTSAVDTRHALVTSNLCDGIRLGQVECLKWAYVAADCRHPRPQRI